MNNIDLNGQTAVVTGGTQGIGFAIALRLIKSGAKVSLWDINREALGLAVDALGEGTLAKQVDITDIAGLSRVHAEVESEVGPVSILVNSAGIAGKNATVEDYDPDEWRKVVEINLNGTFYVNKVVIPSMKARNYGRIVNISSVAGKEGNPSLSAYSAAKAGVLGAHQVVGQRTGQIRHRRECHHARHRQYPDAGNTDERVHRLHAGAHSRGRFLEVEEAAAMVAWLVSKDNSFTTASVFDLSGGRTTY